MIAAAIRKNPARASAGAYMPEKKSDFTFAQKAGMVLLFVASFAAEEYSGFGFGFLKLSYQVWIAIAVITSAVGGAMLARWWGMITGAVCGATGFSAVAW